MILYRQKIYQFNQRCVIYSMMYFSYIKNLFFAKFIQNIRSILSAINTRLYSIMHNKKDGIKPGILKSQSDRDYADLRMQIGNKS